MPLSGYYGGHGEKVMSNMKETYGSDEKAKEVFYAKANKDKKKKSKKDKPWVCDNPPLFLERCDFCEFFWPSNVKFQNVVVRGSRCKYRACIYCVEAMHNGPPTKDKPVEVRKIV